MKNEKIQEFLEKLKDDPRALELMKGIEVSRDQDGEIKAYAELAGKLGYDITESDLKEYLIGAGKRIQQKTEEASSKIQEIPAEVLDKVAGGGKGHDECKDTFQSQEDCWFNDGCDNIIHSYADYYCRNLN